MAIIGGILLAAGCIWYLIIWIKTIIKCFKAQDTLWGILTILFSPLLGIIWLFMQGQKKPAVNWIIAVIMTVIGYVLVVVPLIQKAMEEGMKTMPQ